MSCFFWYILLHHHDNTGNTIPSDVTDIFQNFMRLTIVNFSCSEFARFSLIVFSLMYTILNT